MAIKKLNLLPFVTTLTLAGLLLSTNASAFERSDYIQVLNIAAKFYGAQRSGDNANWLLAQNPAGSTCHMNDGQAYAPGYDLGGGWMDAGDFIKFTQTNAYAAYSLLKAYEVWPGAFSDRDDGIYSDSPNGIPDVLDEVKYATDFLMKIMPDDNTLIARVGGNQDHDYLYTCPVMSTLSPDMGGDPRPVFADGKADVAGIAAAALALMSRLYAPHDTEYAEQLKAMAIRLDGFAMANPGNTSDQYYPEGVCENSQGDDGTYDEENYENSRCATVWHDGEFRDAQMCGAIELFRLTGTQEYFDRAKSLSDAMGDHGWVAGWSENSDYCRHSLALAGDENATTLLKIAADRTIDTVSENRYIADLAYYMPWGSLNNALSGAFGAALAFELSGQEKYRQLAISQANYALGDNEYDRSFIVGWGKNPPQHPHHANSLGLDEGSFNNFNNSSTHKYPLTGALVGGPTDEAVDGTKLGYSDDVEDYIGNEVTIYYNSALVGTLAFAASN